uniref:Secreted protein n=1 Tax=Ixodes ricinus TaxID=34613 RepID=A0A6B0UHQ2_IXORI
MRCSLTSCWSIMLSPFSSGSISSIAFIGWATSKQPPEPRDVYDCREGSSMLFSWTPRELLLFFFGGRAGGEPSSNCSGEAKSCRRPGLARKSSLPRLVKCVCL